MVRGRVRVRVEPFGSRALLVGLMNVEVGVRVRVSVSVRVMGDGLW